MAIACLRGAMIAAMATNLARLSSVRVPSRPCCRSMVRQFSPHASGSGIPHVEALLQEVISTGSVHAGASEVPRRISGDRLRAGAGPRGADRPDGRRDRGFRRAYLSALLGRRPRAAGGWRRCRPVAELVFCARRTGGEVRPSQCQAKRQSETSLIEHIRRDDDCRQLLEWARGPFALSAAQCTSRRMPRSIQPRMVAPAPISMSSECAPVQRIERRSPEPASSKVHPTFPPERTERALEQFLRSQGIVLNAILLYLWCVRVTKSSKLRMLKSVKVARAIRLPILKFHSTKFR